MEMSKLEYGACVWDPSRQNEINKSENVHEKQAARFVTNNYGKSPGIVTNKVNKHRDLKWNTLQESRQYSSLSFFS